MTAARPLAAYLSRLIWLCVLPPMLLALWLAVDSVRRQHAERDREAANLAQNFAIAIDQHLNARIGALNILALSPLVDDPARWPELYREAQGFRESFGSHVLLADVGEPMRMLFNTRVPLGTPLPPLPRPKGHAAAPAAVATGKPAVGDTFQGPIAKEPLVAIAVPALRGGRVTHLLLTIFETRQFQQRLDRLALPAGWALSLLDGRGEVIARRAPPGLEPDRDVDEAGRFVVRSAVSPWSVALEIPREAYRAPLLAATLALGLGVLGATLAGVLGGTLAGRRLGRAVAALAETPAAAAPPHIAEIAEIAAARRQLDASAAAMRRSEQALRENQAAALEEQKRARLAALNQMEDANAARRSAEAAEQEVRRLNAELEQRVELRTAELKAANRELDSFAYAVSHDLRAPLRAMNGFARALAEDYGDRLDGEAKTYLGHIQAASRRMSDLIDGLLALSRSTRGALRRDAVDVSALATRLLEELARGEPGRRVDWQVAPGLRASGDARMIESILRNLLGNAWKYGAQAAAPGIRVYDEETGEGVHRICVADNGAGFDMAHADQLFQPFRRLHREDEFPGIGIGLATVQRIVHRHGGTIEARGEPGRGAVFCFSLPDTPPDAAPADNKEA